jgi:hypothetical protein
MLPAPNVAAACRLALAAERKERKRSDNHWIRDSAEGSPDPKNNRLELLCLFAEAARSGEINLDVDDFALIAEHYDPRDSED